jgi:hypothetical protein
MSLCPVPEPGPILLDGQEMYISLRCVSNGAIVTLLVDALQVQKKMRDAEHVSERIQTPEVGKPTPFPLGDWTPS